MITQRLLKLSKYPGNSIGLSWQTFHYDLHLYIKLNSNRLMSGAMRAFSTALAEILRFSDFYDIRPKSALWHCTPAAVRFFRKYLPKSYFIGIFHGSQLCISYPSCQKYFIKDIMNFFPYSDLVSAGQSCQENKFINIKFFSSQNSKTNLQIPASWH